VPAPHRIVWRPAALPQESLAVGAVLLFWTLHTARERLARAMSGPSFGPCLRRSELRRRRALLANALTFDCKREVRGRTDPLISGCWPRGASGRGGPRRAGSGRRGEVHSCMGRSENRWWGPGEGHGQRRRGGDVPLQFYSALLGSDGSVWPRAVGPASFAPCLRRYDVNNVHSSPKPDFLSTPQATSGPFPVLAVGRIGAWRAASRGQRAPRRSALVHGPVRGQAGGGGEVSRGGRRERSARRAGRRHGQRPRGVAARSVRTLFLRQTGG